MLLQEYSPTKKVLLVIIILGTRSGSNIWLTGTKVVARKGGKLFILDWWYVWCWLDCLVVFCFFWKILSPWLFSTTREVRCRTGASAVRGWVGSVVYWLVWYLGLGDGSIVPSPWVYIYIYTHAIHHLGWWTHWSITRTSQSVTDWVRGACSIDPCVSASDPCARVPRTDARHTRWPLPDPALIVAHAPLSPRTRPRPTHCHWATQSFYVLSKPFSLRCSFIFYFHQSF
jgi:hypothetical protein